MHCKDILAVGYADFDSRFLKPGLICCWTIKNIMVCLDITVFLLFVVYSCYHFFYLNLPILQGLGGLANQKIKKNALVQLITSNILDVPQETPTPHAFYLNMIRGTKTPTTHSLWTVWTSERFLC